MPDIEIIPIATGIRFVTMAIAVILLFAFAAVTIMGTAVATPKMFDDS